jgi:exopolyphosphatase/guanosine-5'-triphosphate,3'-diphosphate pyrophosphatase
VSRLISGERRAVASATADLAAPAPYLVVDIGGGSTELVSDRRADGLVSLDIGCVASPSILESDPPAPEELSNAVATVRDMIADVPRVVPGAADAATLVGLAGTVTTVAAIELGLPEYDPERIHHFRLTRAAAEDVFRTLATESAVARAHNPGLEAGRGDVIVGGAIVLVFRVLGFDEMLVARPVSRRLVRSQVRNGGDRGASPETWRSGVEPVNPPTRRRLCRECQSWI